MDKLWLAQKSSNRTPLGFRSGRPFLSITPLQVTLSLPMWALKSPSRTMAMRGSERSIPNPKAQGGEPLVHQGELQHMSAELRSYEQAQTGFGTVLVWPVTLDLFALGVPTRGIKPWTTQLLGSFRCSNPSTTISAGSRRGKQNTINQFYWDNRSHIDNAWYFLHYCHGGILFFVQKFKNKIKKK